MPDPSDPWDLDRLRLPSGSHGEVRPPTGPPRHRRGEAFLRGPIPFHWMAAACRLPGSGLHVATSFQFLQGRYGSPNRWGLDAVAIGLRISPATARRGLHAAELAGLLSVVREPGCKISVEVTSPAAPAEASR